jgi:shikimate kinase
MGTGKTTVGRRVAEMTGRAFVDSDAVVVERSGMNIPEIFSQKGEDYFREIEAVVCHELAMQEGLVIATGGGMLIDADNRRVMQESGLVVCLRATPETIEQRLADQWNRPLLRGDWRGLLARRQAAYAEIPHQIDTTGKAAGEVAEEIVLLWQNQSR